MDELELLKKDWSKGSEKFKEYSESDLFAMIKGKSVSVARTVFLIAIAELLFFHIIGYFTPDDNEKAPLFVELLDWFASVLPFIFIGIVIYLNGKLKSENNPKRLMKNILDMRKTVRVYINMILVEFLILVTYMDSQSLYNYFPKESATTFGFHILYLVISFGIVFLLIKWFYKLLYGNMLKKLKANYEELVKLEESHA